MVKLEQIFSGGESEKEALSFAKYSNRFALFSTGTKFVPENCCCCLGVGMTQKRFSVDVKLFL